MIASVPADIVGQTRFLFVIFIRLLSARAREPRCRQGAGAPPRRLRRALCPDASRASGPASGPAMGGVERSGRRVVRHSRCVRPAVPPHCHCRTQAWWRTAAVQGHPAGSGPQRRGPPGFPLLGPDDDVAGGLRGSPLLYCSPAPPSPARGPARGVLSLLGPGAPYRPSYGPRGAAAWQPFDAHLISLMVDHWRGTGGHELARSSGFPIPGPADNFPNLGKLNELAISLASRRHGAVFLSLDNHYARALMTRMTRHGSPALTTEIIMMMMMMMMMMIRPSFQVDSSQVASDSSRVGQNGKPGSCH